IGATRAKIDGHHRLDLRGLAPVHELVRTEGVGLGREPGEVELLGAFILGSHSVFPIVTGYEVSAGIADDGGPQFIDEIENIAPEPLLVGGRGSRLANPPVDAATEMLDTRPTNARIRF